MKTNVGPYLEVTLHQLILGRICDGFSTLVIGDVGAVGWMEYLPTLFLSLMSCHPCFHVLLCSVVGFLLISSLFILGSSFVGCSLD